MTFTHLRRLVAVGGPKQADGQALVEYSLMILLIAIALVLSLAAFGGDLSIIYETINERLPF